MRSVRLHTRSYMSQEGLEDRVTSGGVIYLDSIERDPGHGQLIFRLLASETRGCALVPLFGRVVRVLTFTGVQDYTEWWEEGEVWQPQDMYQVIGIVETPEESHTRYTVILD